MDIDAAVVLAAGEGQRLRPLTAHRPKPMLPAASRPILEWVLDALVDAGIDDLHLVVGYKRDRVQNHFGSTYRNRPVTYHTQTKQLGSGHALLQARETLEQDFVAVNGDELVTADVIRAVTEAHSTSDAVTLAVIESEQAPMYGAVQMDGDRIAALVEQPDRDAYRLLNAGVYAFGPSIFAELDAVDRREGELHLTDAVARFTDNESSARGVRVDYTRTEVTYPWDLLEVAGRLLRSESVDEPEPDQGVFVSDAATVHPDATLRPPVVVSADAVIEPRAVVGPNVAVGRNATVGAGTVVERTVLDADSRVAPTAALVDLVAGEGARVGVGSVIEGGPADVRVGTRIHEDAPLGAVIADQAVLAGGVTVSPGALIGPDAHVNTGAHVHRNVPSEGVITR